MAVPLRGVEKGLSIKKKSTFFGLFLYVEKVSTAIISSSKSKNSNMLPTTIPFTFTYRTADISLGFSRCQIAHRNISCSVRNVNDYSHYYYQGKSFLYFRTHEVFSSSVSDNLGTAYQLFLNYTFGYRRVDMSPRPLDAQVARIQISCSVTKYEWESMILCVMVSV